MHRSQNTNLAAELIQFFNRKSIDTEFSIMDINTFFNDPNFPLFIFHQWVILNIFASDNVKLPNVFFSCSQHYCSEVVTSCAPNTVLDGVKQDVDDGLAGLPDLNDEV